MATGSGLASPAAFMAAVPDAKDAPGVLYVNIATVVSKFSDQFALDARTMKNVDVLSALSTTTRPDGDRLSYRVRLTPK